MPTISTSLTPFSLKFRTPMSSPGISCSKLTHTVTVTVTVTLLLHHNNASLFTISCATVLGFSWTAILSLSSSKLVPVSHFPTKGQELHSFTIKLGLQHDVFVQNALLSMYSFCGLLHNARQVFDEIPLSVRDVVSWNSMVSGCIQGRCY